jgi:Tfp pilus assembly protein PilF
LKFARHREWQQGATELETAVAIDPEFSDAHGNLAVHYLMVHRLNDAVTELRRAIAIEPGVSMYHSNLALVYVMQERTSEAKTEAETAVTLDARNAKAQYLLGVLLARNPEYRAAAEKHLNFAAEEMPDAHLILMKLYRSRGDESNATREMDRYKRAMSSFK